MHDKLEDLFRWSLEGGVTPPDVSVGACMGLGWVLELTVDRGSFPEDHLGKIREAWEKQQLQRRASRQ